MLLCHLGMAHAVVNLYKILGLTTRTTVSLASSNNCFSLGKFGAGLCFAYLAKFPSLIGMAAAQPTEEGLDEKLTCPICFGIFTDPKKLQCSQSHVFCHGCLIQETVQGQSFISCPICHQLTPVESLRPAFHIIHHLKVCILF